MRFWSFCTGQSARQAKHNAQACGPWYRVAHSMFSHELASCAYRGRKPCWHADGLQGAARALPTTARFGGGCITRCAVCAARQGSGRNHAQRWNASSVHAAAGARRRGSAAARRAAPPCAAGPEACSNHALASERYYPWARRGGGGRRARALGQRPAARAQQRHATWRRRRRERKLCVLGRGRQREEEEVLASLLPVCAAVC